MEWLLIIHAVGVIPVFVLCIWLLGTDEEFEPTVDDYTSCTLAAMIMAVLWPITAMFIAAFTLAVLIVGKKVQQNSKPEKSPMAEQGRDS